MATQFYRQMIGLSRCCLYSASAGATLLLVSSTMAQGGGNANAVGNSLEAATNAAAATNTANNSGGSRGGGSPSGGPPSGTVTGATPSGRPSGASPSGPPPGYGASSPSGYGSNDGGPPDMNEYGDDSGYGYEDGSSGYGGQPVSTGSSAQRAQIMMLGLSQQIAKSIASLFAEPRSNDPAAKVRQLTLWEQAALAFHQGDQKKALALYHAHMISDGDAAGDARSAVQYSRLLKRPVWVLRFGVSIHPRVPAGLADDPQPILESTKIASAVRGRGAAGRGGFQDDGSGGPPDESGRSEENSGSPDESEYDGSGGVQAKPRITMLGGQSKEATSKLLDRNLGLIADVTKEMFAGLQGTGKFGHAFDSMESKGAELAAMTQDLGDTSPSDLPMWIPGIDFVGEGPATEMLAKAKASEIDFLLHFDVIVKENRLGPPQYQARCKLQHVETGEIIVTSKLIDKFEIASKPTGNRESIQEIMNTMFDVINKKVSCEPMPALQPQNAVSRIETLLATKKPDALRNLAEIVMFRSRDLITPEQLDQAFYFAGNEQSLALLHEEEVDRYERVNNYVERELRKDEEK